VVIRVVRRKANRRHMTGDRDSQGLGRPTLLVRAAGGILGTHNHNYGIAAQAWPAALPS
jgi:hypothetical protein